MKALAIAYLSMAAICGSPSSADILRTDGRTATVRVTTFDRLSLRYTEGCEGSELKSASWTDVRSVTFQPACGAASESVKVVVPECQVAALDVFVVLFGESSSAVIAESVSLTTNGTLHLDLFHPWDQAHGPISQVESISKQKMCRGQVPESYVVPQTYCHESRQVAVAFDYGSPLSNRILTNGFSFVLDIVGAPPDGFNVDAFGDEVRSAFQNGISLWVTSIADRGLLLTPDLRKFLKDRTSTSPGGYSMLLPPQVIRLKCPQSATFVVELGFLDEELFPRFPLVLARAKIEGRTIALNMKPFKCFRSELKFDGAKQLRFQLDDGCINLIPIITHELGHAFGLNHFDDVNSHSLMDSRFSRDALVPTERDVAALIATLERTIDGAAPGILKFVSSAGVQPPADWVPELTEKH
jgi:hypothetical protein